MNKFTDFLARTRKAFTALVGVLATGYATANSDGVITQAEWAYLIGISLLTVVAVWGIKNKPESKKATPETVR